MTSFRCWRPRHCRLVTDRKRARLCRDGGAQGEGDHPGFCPCKNLGKPRSAVLGPCPHPVECAVGLFVRRLQSIDAVLTCRKGRQSRAEAKFNEMIAPAGSTKKLQDAKDRSDWRARRTPTKWTYRKTYGEGYGPLGNLRRQDRTARLWTWFLPCALTAMRSARRSGIDKQAGLGWPH
jgi:hypothetical protein